MYTEGSQCNESPLVTAFALQQMLLQSFNGELHVFPALPSTWPNASFFNMRTEGAFLVSASARHGATRASESSHSRARRAFCARISGRAGRRWRASLRAR